MRTFIAIELPQNFRNYLADIQNLLKATGADVKWVPLENIHLTLKFLGEIDDKKLDKVTEILDSVASGENQFFIRLDSLGAFPNTNFPRVIWSGIDKGDKETRKIANAIEERIATIGIPKEDRPFSSHITIGRVRSGLSRIKLTQLLNELQDKPGKENLEFAAGKITLFKSQLTPKGPIYEILKEASLKAT